MPSQQGLTQGLGPAQDAVETGVPITFVSSPTGKVQYYQWHPSGTAHGTALLSGQPARKKLKPKSKRRKIIRSDRGTFCPDFCVIWADGAAGATGQAEVVFVVTNPSPYRPVLSPTCTYSLHLLSILRDIKAPSDYKFTLHKGPAALLLSPHLCVPLSYG